MNMKVDLCGVTLNNPVMTASGTFGAGEEYSEFVDLNRLGAVLQTYRGRAIRHRVWLRYTVAC